MVETPSTQVECSCMFCDEFSQQAARPSRIVWERDGLVLLPSIGSFSPGYLLLMPKAHVRSFAHLSSSELELAHTVAETVRGEIGKEFGPTIIAEHGPGAEGDGSSACCDHAHWHLIPTDVCRVAAMYEEVGGGPILLQRINHLQKWAQTPYIYLSPLKGVSWIWRHAGIFPSQFVRRVCASILGVEEFYDWATFPFADNMLITRRRLQEHISLKLHGEGAGSARAC